MLRKIFVVKTFSITSKAK